MHGSRRPAHPEDRLTPVPIIVYRDVILALSETFVATPGPHLRRYEAWYSGTTIRFHPLVNESRVIAPTRRGTLAPWRSLAFKVAGRVPAGWLRRMRAIGAELLHAQFGTDGVFAEPVARKLDVPLVVTFYGFDATIDPAAGLVWRLYARKRRRLYRSAARILTVSEFIRNRLIADGCPADLVETHYTGVDTELFRPHEPAARERLVLFVGRLVEKKGCADLIRAMAQVRALEPDVTLVVIGEGPMRQHLERLARSAGNVSFAGALEPPEVRTWMQRASIFALPSRTARSADAEGLPFVILEAQSMALPVVSTRHAGIPEAVVHGSTGLLCAEKDVDALAANILLLLRDENLRRRMGEAGRARVIESFNLRHQTERLEQIYDDVLRRAWAERQQGRTHRP